MIYGIIHNKKFKLYYKSEKIRGPQLSEDEKRYIKACVKDIFLTCEKDRTDTYEEFLVKNLPNYGIKIGYYKINLKEKVKLDPFLKDFFSGTNITFE